MSKFFTTRLTTMFVVTTLTMGGYAQEKTRCNEINYTITTTGLVSSGENAPFWFSANRYGQVSTDKKSGIISAAIRRDAETDSLKRWRLGYGAELTYSSGLTTKAFVQQAYTDIQYRPIRLSIGQKERPLELKDQELSSGSMVSGINYRPIPQIRLELPDFWVIPRTGNWLALKGHVAYGVHTDNRWQRNFVNYTNHKYTENSLYHSKAGFLRIGNTEKFPITLTGGLEMVCQFGGKGYNLIDREGVPYSAPQSLPHGFKAYWDALFMGGSDVNDGEQFANVGGNQTGSWHLRLDYLGKGWKVGAYAEHLFEDHSQMFWQYGWKDMLYGIEAHLPTNKIVSDVTYEHIRTTHQSGPIYHDATEGLPIQISGSDNYYHNHIYGCFQHAGMVMGNPLILSPIYNNKDVSPGYNTRNDILPYHNRIVAHHIGLKGYPYCGLTYRILYTHEKSLGIYGAPVLNPLHANFLIVELSYNVKNIEGLNITAAYGLNQGTLLKNSNGAMLTIAYTGKIKRKETKR